MKRSKKLTITALVAMLFMAIAVTFLTFSHADEEPEDLLGATQVAEAVEVSSKTNIDYIAENSYSTDSDVDPNYNIVEIYSDKPSELKTYVESKDFETLVINGYITESCAKDAMNSGKINYTAYQTKDITNESTDVLVAISNADLIYVNQGTTPFGKGNDLCESLYDILHTYAVGDYKPLIINSESQSGSNGNNNTQQETMGTLARDVFSSGKYYYTFAWNYPTLSAVQFLGHTGGSLYLGINGNKQKGKWTTLVDAADDTKTYSMARFLVISDDGTAVSGMETGLLGDLTIEFNPAGFNANGAAYTAPTGAKIYENTGIVKNDIYNLKYDTPDLVQVEKAKISEIEASYDLGKYDFILIDDTVTGDITVTDPLYKKLAGAMYGNVSIVYPSNMAASSSSSTSTTVTDTQAYNYLELYYMVATADNIARYDNVMVTSSKELGTILGGGETGAGAIASLINKSTYRGIGGKGSSSNMYTVLEIQPCYPIDTALAESQGGYYTVPANVLNDVDKDTLRDEDGKISVEYYNWYLTRKKIADAVGIDVSKINLVHMSTEELAANKEPLLGTYDLIYIGGDTSAFKTAENWLSVAGLAAGSNHITNFKLGDNLTYALDRLPIYTMYAHNGDMVTVSTESLGYGTGVGSIPTGNVVVNGTAQTSFSLLNGNDISFDRLKELKEFVDAGMPVIVDNTLANAYNIVGTAEKNGNIYIQHIIDPDCNMYKFLRYCNDNGRVTTDGNTNGRKKTVLWGVNNSPDEAYFDSEWNPKVNSLIKGSKTRPKLTVTSLPIEYNFYDKSTRLDSSELKFSYEVDGSTNYETKFYVDDDGNSIFDEATEEMTDKAEVTKNSLKISLDNYFGPVYWKLEVKDKDTNMTAYITGLSYIKNSSGTKQTVRILQIMPGYSKTENGKTVAKVKGKYNEESPEGAQGMDTLYFCPICQRGFELYEYYPIANTNSHLGMWYYGTGAYLQSNTNPSEARNSQNPYLGLHEHVFGIPRYDSNLTVEGYTGVDDWSTNLADDVSDLYDFDLDIMVRGDFEQTAVDIAKAYDFSTLTQAQKNTKINNFSIDASDPDYAEWSALTTDDEKLKFITKREYKERANDEYQLYSDAKDEADALIPALETALDTAINTNADGFSEDLKVVQKTKRYADMFSAVSNDGSSGFRYRYMHNATLQALANAYFDYRDKKDIEIQHHQKYKEYMRYTYPDNWLAGSYDMVIIGAADAFGHDDISNPQALADLKDYIDPKGNNGSLLLFHDTLSAATDGGSATLTATLRDYFGMNRNRGLTNDNPQSGTYYVPYASSDENRYFMTNLSTKPKTDTTRYANWPAEMKAIDGNMSWINLNKYLSNIAYSDSFAISDYGTNSKGSPYKYADQAWETVTAWAMSSNASDFKNLKASGKYGTDKASQNNKGIVTQYPFTLSDELNISPTHPQIYALELDNPYMTVWYSLAGGTNKAIKTDKQGTFSCSSMYAATRNDGMDNYFIYSFGNVSYCGAGHSKVTGVGLDNNDERRLYINIIVNSVKKSVNQPSITVYDYKTEKKKDKDGSDYIMEVKNTDDWPEFSFRATVDTTVADNKIARIRIYYDLDYLTHNSYAFVNDKYHVLIADMTKDKDGNPLKSGTIYDVGRELTFLQLKPEYFEPYNQEYTYIIIEVTDSNGNIAYQRIKIKLLPTLFELTQNDINKLDISDRRNI